jgi:ATP-binding cassette subfamily C exporter for protease/lipase
MDEPNSNLDQENEQYLIDAIAHMKARGATQIIVTHRSSLIDQADFLMVLRAGNIQMYGTKDEVLAALNPATTGNAQAAPVEIVAE